jgi:hypothetical protein
MRNERVPFAEEIDGDRFDIKPGLEEFDLGLWHWFL